MDEDILEKEFQLLDIESFVNKKDDVEVYAAASIVQIKKTYDENVRFKRRAVIMNFINSKIDNLFRLFGIGFYDNLVLYYIDMLDQEMDLCLDFIEYQSKLMDIVTDTNFKEVFKLSKFSDTNFILNYNFLERSFDRYSSSLNGIYRCDNNPDIERYNREAFNSFFDSKIQKLSSSKVYQKVL